MLPLVNCNCSKQNFIQFGAQIQMSFIFKKNRFHFIIDNSFCDRSVGIPTSETSHCYLGTNHGRKLTLLDCMPARLTEP